MSSLFFFILCFLLALAVPMWSVLLSPVLFGAIHSLASGSLITSELSVDKNQKRNLTLVATVFGVFVFFRALGLFRGFENIASIGPNFEIVAGSLLVTFFLMQSQADFVQVLLTTLPGILLAFLVYWDPYVTVIGLSILHNVIALVYWISFSENPNQTRWRWVCVAFYTVATFGIFSLAELHRLSPQVSDSTFVSLAAIFPVSGEANQARLLVAFAFGLLIHYYVWLQMFAATTVVKRFPIRFLLLAMGVLGASSLAILFVPPVALRAAVVAILAIHGFYEVSAVLPLLRKRGVFRRMR